METASVWSILGFAMIPAAGNFAGGVLAELLPLSRRALSIALHLAAGLVIGLVAIEIAPRALASGPTWAMALAVVGGGALFLAADAAMGIVRRRVGTPSGAEEGEQERGPWMIYMAVAIDLFSDGVMIGAGSSVAAELGILLALGQVVADVPEGFATIAALKQQRMRRRTRLALAAAFAIPVLAGALLGYFGVRDAAESVQVGVLVFTAGVLLTATLEEILPEAHSVEDTRMTTLAIVLGFGGFMLLSHYLG